MEEEPALLVTIVSLAKLMGVSLCLVFQRQFTYAGEDAADDGAATEGTDADEAVETGHTVVEMATVEVTTWVDRAGQSFTEDAQLVTVKIEVANIVEVVIGTFNDATEVVLMMAREDAGLLKIPEALEEKLLGASVVTTAAEDVLALVGEAVLLFGGTLLAAGLQSKPMLCIPIWQVLFFAVSGSANVTDLAPPHCVFVTVVPPAEQGEIVLQMVPLSMP